ncbi:hypothetical protein DSN88_08750 [Campylobacter jejuni]|nr:hypothetical protein [Campylobacter jejuni]
MAKTYIVEFIFLGREIFNRKLPAVYIDFSHTMDNMQNGHYLLKSSFSKYFASICIVRDTVIGSR